MATESGVGRGGSGVVPEIVVATPALAGSEDFRIGISGALPGAGARLISWQDGEAPTTSATIELESTAFAGGTATVFQPLTGVEPGTTMHFVWQVDDPSAPGAHRLRRAVGYIIQALGDFLNPGTGLCSIARLVTAVKNLGHRIERKIARCGDLTKTSHGRGVCRIFARRNGHLNRW